jgi:peptide chain release factor 1
VHTSTITVALLDSQEYREIKIDMDELRIETTRGSGNGGQHKNTTDSCVVITHIPTGVKVVRDGRSQHKNKDEALKEIKERLNEFYLENHMNKVSKERKGQIGTGNRGSEKKRTYNQKMDLVVDHESDKSTSLKQFMKGKLELLMC